MSWYKVFRGMVSGLLPLVADLRVSGREHIPESGPFFLVANHESILDPMLVQSHCGRVVYTFTKSSQFGSPLLRWLMPRVNGIPVRRFQVDPQAVRTALRRLDAGEGVGIYPEGERSWDGQLQPFRRGTIRLLLGLGVPVVPAWVEGSYQVWPRWSRRPTRGRVHVRYGPAIRFGAHRGRMAREAALGAAEERLRAAMRSLAGADRPRNTAATAEQDP